VTRVLAVRSDSAGDVLLTGPALRALSAGAEHLTLLCGPRGRAAAELLPGVGDLACRHLPWIDPEPEPVSSKAMGGLMADVAACAVDEAVIFTSFHQSPLPLALLLRLAGVGRISAISVDYPGSLLDVRHRVGDDVHEVERGLSLADAAGFPAPADDDRRLRVERPRDATPAGDGPYVVVHPGTSVPARAWPATHHRALVAALAARGRRVVVTGAPAERALTAFVAGRDALDLGGALSLGELADVLAGADVLVVANTGPAHLAAAVGTPVVSLFAPTVPAVRWRPWAVAHALLSAPRLADVAPEQALAALERLAPTKERIAT
jgi:ADP-heptose:LPS heptosyltransferase